MLVAASALKGPIARKGEKSQEDKGGEPVEAIGYYYSKLVERPHIKDSGKHEWNQLRSHDSTVGRGSRIKYMVETRDTKAYIVLLSLAYTVDSG